MRFNFLEARTVLIRLSDMPQKVTKLSVCRTSRYRLSRCKHNECSCNLSCTVLQPPSSRLDYNTRESGGNRASPPQKKNQSINLSINQSINQSINDFIKVSEYVVLGKDPQ